MKRLIVLAAVCWGSHVAAQDAFPPELVKFTPYAHNPIFTAAGPGTWEVKIRERGWILREGNLWRMWYTGYDGTRDGQKKLGYAISSDGLHWQRHPSNPIYDKHWVEDMMVVHHGDTYYMFAEGQDDIAQLLTSPNGRDWTRVGPLDIRLKSGQPIPPGPRGTPTAWVEGDTWYLFYERRDLGIWLATSRDRKVWTNVQDEPVIALGPDKYDQHAVALNQIVKYKDRYYAYYHASDSDQPGRQWTTDVASSPDLIHWTKYPGNPLLRNNQSSGILVFDGQRMRLYSMHDQVRVHFAE